MYLMGKEALKGISITKDAASMLAAKATEYYDNKGIN